MTENKEKADLIKKALKLVDDLGKLTIADPMDDYDKLDDLMKRAKKIRMNKHWKLN